MHTISLADARAKAAECRKQLSEGIDPIEGRKSQRTKFRLAAMHKGQPRDHNAEMAQQVFTDLTIKIIRALARGEDHKREIITTSSSGT